jgi:hypothetical protein
MHRFLLIGLSIACSSCGGVPDQPRWLEAVAAYEVPLPDAADKARFLALLEDEAEAGGFHVDAATPEELRFRSSATFSASVWRGANDEESMLSAMDHEGNIGSIWIIFPRGQNAERSAQFRQNLVPKIVFLWPETRALPIMPTGAIPNPSDLIRTPTGYIVNPSVADKYGVDVRK